MFSFYVIYCDVSSENFKNIKYFNNFDYFINFINQIYTSKDSIVLNVGYFLSDKRKEFKNGFKS